MLMDEGFFNGATTIFSVFFAIVAITIIVIIATHAKQGIKNKIHLYRMS